MEREELFRVRDDCYAYEDGKLWHEGGDGIWRETTNEYGRGFTCVRNVGDYKLFALRCDRRIFPYTVYIVADLRSGHAFRYVGWHVGGHSKLGEVVSCLEDIAGTTV